MSFESAAYPILVGYSFGLLASIALIAVFVRRGRWKEDAFLIAALVVLAGIYEAGIWATRQRLASGADEWRLAYVGVALRMIFAGLAINDATRVILAIACDRLTIKELNRTRFAPALWYVFAFVMLFVAAFDKGHLRSFPLGAFVGILASSAGLIQLVKKLSPTSPMPVGFFGRWHSSEPEPPISLNLSPASPAVLTPLISDTEAKNLTSLRWVAVVAVAAIAIEEAFAHKLGSPIVGFFRLATALALLPCFFGLIQYHARALFFDVVLKRGILVTALALTWVVLMPLLLPANSAPELLALLALAAAAVSLGWIWTYAQGDAWLDRLIFHRPDYAKTCEAITAGMTQCSTEDQLTDYVAAKLAEALRAGWVEFHATIDKPASAAVKIASGDRLFGYLLCGPRYRLQAYRSEDLQFLETIGAYFGGSLQSFETQKMEELAARSELKALRAQINPHFLFNALNTLADMAHSTPEAEKAILNLSRVFRFALDSTRHETVPLRDEVAFIRAYLEIERARFESKLKFSIEVPDAVLDHPVPPMLMQPLVENAIKHGISKKLDGGWVRVTVTPSVRGLMIKVEDNGVGFVPAGLKPNIGLTNVRQRVEALGGSWWVDSTPGRGASVAFELVDREGAAA